MIDLALPCPRQRRAAVVPICIAFAASLDARDRATADHSDRVRAYALRLSPGLHLDEHATARLRAAAWLHDIGKIAIPDYILQKPGPLTPEEALIMQTHAGLGAELVRPLLPEVVPIIRGHHERWDGAGYPDGLVGTEIPLEARIIAVCDSYDAMTSDRPYRTGMSAAAACAVLQFGAGTQWDAELVEVFVDLIGVVQHAPLLDAA